MYTAVTNDIQVTVLPEFLDDRSEPDEGRYFWAYTIEITNLGRAEVQLIARHWIITDALGQVETVQAASASWVNSPCSNRARLSAIRRAARSRRRAA